MKQTMKDPVLASSQPIMTSLYSSRLRERNTLCEHLFLARHQIGQRLPHSRNASALKTCRRRQHSWYEGAKGKRGEKAGQPMRSRDPALFQKKTIPDEIEHGNCPPPPGRIIVTNQGKAHVSPRRVGSTFKLPESRSNRQTSGSAQMLLVFLINRVHCVHQALQTPN